MSTRTEGMCIPEPLLFSTRLSLRVRPYPYLHAIQYADKAYPQLFIPHRMRIRPISMQARYVRTCATFCRYTATDPPLWWPGDPMAEERCPGSPLHTP